jgi:hypothetical protein
MPRLLDRTAENVILTLIVRDANGSPVPNLAFNAAGLAAHYRASAGTTWTAITLAAATAGTWTEGGWVHLGDGVYQLGLPNDAIVPGDRTTIRLTYGANPKQYDSIDAVLSQSLRPSVVVENAGAPVVDEGAAFTITQRDDFEDDADIGPIGPIRIETDLPLLRESNPPRLRFGATQRLGSRYSETTHIIGTAYAEAVAGESDQYDIFIEITAAELNKPPGLYGWDVEAVFADNDVRTIVDGQMTLKPSMGDNEERDPLNPEP